MCLCLQAVLFERNLATQSLRYTAKFFPGNETSEPKPDFKQMHTSVLNVWAFLHREGTGNGGRLSKWFKMCTFKMYHRDFLQL